MMNKLMQLLRDNASAERKPLNFVRADGADDAPKVATLYLYDVIDNFWGISAKSVADATAGLDADTTLNVHINSPGGDVFEARAIKTLLDGVPGPVNVFVDGLAASAATTIAMAGDEIVMADGAYFMIHNAWSIALGNKSDMLDMAALLEKMDGTIATDYATRSGKPLADVAALMDAETWFTAQEAVDAGLANRVAEPPKKAAASNHWNLAVFDRVPKALAKSKGTHQLDQTALLARNRRHLDLLDRIA